MSNRGHTATFPTDNTDDDQGIDVTNIVQLADPRLFHIQVADGGELSIDLTTWSQPLLTAAIAPLFHEHIRQMGPAPIRRTVYCKTLELQRFWRFLDSTRRTVSSLDEVTAGLIGKYEDWLEQNTPSESALRRLISPLIAVMRLAVEATPERFPQALVNRLKWLSRGQLNVSKPRDAYSSGVAAALRAAARKQILEASLRILTADEAAARRPDIEDNPVLHPYYDAVIDTIVKDGVISTRTSVYWRLKGVLWNRKMPPPSAEALHAQFYLIPADLVAFIVLLSLETGMEIECLKGLKVDCLHNPSRGYVEIEYLKRRAIGAEWKRLRVRDGASSTPGAIIRQAIKLTERARQHLGTDNLWSFWTGYRLDVAKVGRGSVDDFVERHALLTDDGQSLHLELSRLRKTQKAERYIKSQGQLDDFAVGHTVAVAARHYADIPALRHVHERTIGEALQDALESALNPRLLPPALEVEARLNPSVAGLSANGEQVAALLDGDQDVWLASCSGFHVSPFGNAGDACPTPFWGCLECTNAVITARKLPALIAFDQFMLEQRALLDADTWAARFGRPHRRISEQILPAFPPLVVAEARRTAEAFQDSLLYLPPEARAS